MLRHIIIGEETLFIFIGTIYFYGNYKIRQELYRQYKIHDSDYFNCRDLKKRDKIISYDKTFRYLSRFWSRARGVDNMR